MRNPGYNMHFIGGLHYETDLQTHPNTKVVPLGLEPRTP